MFPFLKKDGPVKIHFVFNEDRMTMKYVKLWRRIREGLSKEPEADAEQFMAHFMADANDQYLPEKKAIDLLDELTPLEFKDAAAKFIEAVSERMIPKANGSGSVLHSEAGQAGTLPNGS